MRTLSIPTGKLLVIPGETLPEDAAGITVKNGEVFWLSDMRGYGEESLPPGSWSIVGWSDELTGGQIYELGLTVREFKESLRSHGIDRALIIKKEK